MKTKFTLLTVFVAAFLTGFAQQPTNGGFETWTNAYTPSSWSGIEDVIAGANIGISFPSSVWTFKDVATYTEGVTSVKIVSDTLTGYSGLGVIAGVVSYGGGSLVGDTAITFYGTPFTSRPDSLIFDYQFASPGSDTAAISIDLYRNSTHLLGYNGSPGLGLALIKAASWKHIAIPLATFYQSLGNPDSILLQFTSSAINNPVIGSTLLVDNVRFGYITGSNPTITATITAPNTNVCNGDSVLLTANSGTNYTYQWKVGGSPIAGATSITYYAKAAGSYTVTIDSATVSGTSQPVVITANCASGTITATITAPVTNLCNGDSVALTANSGTGYTYQWNLNGSIITGATAITYYARTPGSYSVTIDSAVATGTSQATIVTDTTCPNGIINIIAANFNVYPNPASSILNFTSSDNLSGYALQVYDLVGRVVISQTLTGSNNEINITSLANGTYIYRVTDKQNGIITNKLNVIK